MAALIAKIDEGLRRINASAEKNAPFTYRCYKSAIPKPGADFIELAGKVAEIGCFFLLINWASVSIHSAFALIPYLPTSFDLGIEAQKFIYQGWNSQNIVRIISLSCVLLIIRSARSIKIS